LLQSKQSDDSARGWRLNAGSVFKDTRTPMSVGADEFKRTKRKPIKSNQMSKQDKAKAKEQHRRATNFYEWLEQMGNIHLGDMKAMDRALLIIIDNV
jgi:hypothetical protein